MMFLHRYEDVGLPWRNTVASDVELPESTYAIWEPRTFTFFFVKGNSVAMVLGVLPVILFDVDSAVLGGV